MKKFTIVLFLSLIVSCSLSKYLTQEQSEKIFEHQVTLTKPDIHEKLILFANEKFVSGKEVTQTDEDGLFVGNGIVQLPKDILILKMEFTYIVKYSDNKYKAKWIIKDLRTNSGSIKQNIWGYYAEDIEKAFDRNDSDLFQYLSSDKSDF